MAQSIDDAGEPREWSEELVRRFGLTAKEWRGKRSARWLSERTAELGHHIPSTVIARLDSGHRGSVLSVAEVIVIAAALETSPMALLYPNVPDGPVELLPTEAMPSIDAVQWFSGEKRITRESLSDTARGAYRLENSREYVHFKEMANRARRQSLSSHEGEREIGRKALKDIESILSNLVQSIKNSGWPVDYPLEDDSDA
ncbi:DNA-binding protein [Rhodococcoides fascians]|uniref:DNA-binding protein n=1 Tax=Rhodococcoides fascians TaxID=1828 RepID=UPI001427CD88